ncbi:MAG: cytidine deaminase [Bacteroidales bacterium]|nr:cytidine deaminase [Bacteroidales bacterium]MBR0298028.1 cytidine deaminase [Bacteroidales bacterium]
MTDKKVEILFKEFSSPEEMPSADQKLVRAAMEAQKSSYAPYSHFNVGAAVRLEDGTIIKGSNQENAASPSGLCAERTAMFAAGANYPGVPMVSIAIAGGPSLGLCANPATPCGACRQVMAEYQKIGGKPMSVILVGADKIWKFDRVDDVLPFIFDSI